MPLVAPETAAAVAFRVVTTRNKTTHRGRKKKGASHLVTAFFISDIVQTYCAQHESKPGTKERKLQVTHLNDCVPRRFVPISWKCFYVFCDSAFSSRSGVELHGKEFFCNRFMHFSHEFQSKCALLEACMGRSATGICSFHSRKNMALVDTGCGLTRFERNAGAKVACWSQHVCQGWCSQCTSGKCSVSAP